MSTKHGEEWYCSMNKKILTGIISLIFVAIVAINIYFYKGIGSKAPIPSVETIGVERQKISDTLLASGIVQPNRQEKMNKDETMGKVKSILVHEGQRVSEGTELFYYEGEAIDSSLSQLQIAHQRLMLQKEQSENKIKDLEANLKKNINSVTSIEEAITESQKQKRDLDREIALLQLEIQENEMETDKQRSKKEKLVVKSPLAGIVRKINSIDTISTEPFIVIDSDEPYVIKGAITEFDSVLVQPGQKAVIRPKVLPNLTFNGVVKHLEYTPIDGSIAGSRKNDSVTQYPLTVNLTDRQEGLKEGYHTTIEIEVKSKETIALPQDAILLQGGKEYAFVLDNRIIRKRELKTGFSDDKYKEVIEGVSLGEQVVAHPAANLNDGMEVNSLDSSHGS